MASSVCNPSRWGSGNTKKLVQKLDHRLQPLSSSLWEDSPFKSWMIPQFYTSTLQKKSHWEEDRIFQKIKEQAVGKR